MTRPRTVPWAPTSAAARTRQADALGVIVATVTTLASELDAEQVRAALDRAARTRQDAPRLAAHLRDHPDTLVSGAPIGPLIVGRLIRELQAAGVAGLVVPRCPGCGRTAELRHPRKQSTDADAGGVEGERVCASCFNRSQVGVCARCGRHAQLVTGIRHGEPCCAACKGSRRATCIVCGKHRPVADTKVGGPRCSTCKRRDPSSWEPCGRCGQHRPVNQRAADGTARCRRTTPDRSPICFRCQLDHRLAELLAGPDGTIPAALVLLRDAILAVDNPLTALGWLGRSPAVPILKGLAAGELELTHQALDEVTAAVPEQGSRPRRHAFAVEHLRQLLVACGALPERDPHLARLETFITRQANALASDEDRRLLRTWATWQVLRQLRARVAEGKPTVNRAYNARGRISQAARFLAWLRDQHACLATCQQAHIDRWFADTPGFTDALATRRQARSFLAWANKQRALHGVRLPPRQQQTAAQATDPEQRWALARRLLHDDQLEVADRVAGLLVVLYAQPASRIVRLTIADVTSDDEQTFLRLGHDQVLMPQPLGGLVRQLPTHQPVGMAGHLPASSGSAWLFAGRQPDRPLHPQQLIKRLAALGIPTRATRNAALLQLAAEVPPTVLADLLGLHPTTAVGWVKTAGGDWSRYAAQRSRATSSPPARQEASQ